MINVTITQSEYIFPDFRDMEAIRSESKRLGSHFFSSGAKSFFNSRISEALYGHRVLVTSERMDWTTPRRYTVRVAYIHVDDVGEETFQVATVGEFQQYASRSGAHAAAEPLAAQLSAMPGHERRAFIDQY